MTETEQNKRINQLRRQMAIAIERIKTLELDVEPDGRISEGFSVMERHIDDGFADARRRFDRVDSRLDRIEHQLNRTTAKLEVILEAITGIADLPENDTPET